MENNEFTIMSNNHKDIMGNATTMGNGDIKCENVLNQKTKVVKQQFQANVVHEDKEEEKYIKTYDKK